MADRAFLKPVSTNPPVQGDYRYTPVVRIFEAPTAAGLQALLDADFGVNATSVTEFWVVEQIEFRITQDLIAPMAGEFIYTALVWATKAEKI